ncbi:unnamed protein product [Didymodactylos carnosus]|uniref:Uncharacterized protein n=1 Tax=Didymodactylos carnosus TaxID=1234261 RepID=A0A814FDY3_9BILA|nr:unnamed protein product [Didymodactylos carnosus]CAF1246848.1 unnamed protein product [Didymodactylos carnosus]CAF3754076.1 unnamed protein product [Didymodactylos carnosus]CAF4054466.1 unnamed protein product [Didymodactylos carnosus]
MLCGNVTFDFLHGYHDSCLSFQNGNVNLILSAPHGGTLLPSNVPNRTASCVSSGNTTCALQHNCRSQSNSKRRSITIVQDYLSDEFTKNVAKELYRTYNLLPYMVIGQWSRKKVDFNREVEEATMNHPEGIKGHQSYHNFILDAINKIEKQFGRGLLVDIHGHSQGNYTMIGYLLTGENLNNDKLTTQTSIEELIQSSCPNNRNECINGQSSLGTILEAHDLGISYPSTANPKPGKKVFYSGGYTTRNYISKINAVQTELPYDTRAGPNREEYAKKYAKALYEYMVVNKILIKQ